MVGPFNVVRGGLSLQKGSHHCHRKKYTEGRVLVRKDLGFEQGRMALCTASG